MAPARSAHQSHRPRRSAVRTQRRGNGRREVWLTSRTSVRSRQVRTGSRFGSHGPPTRSIYVDIDCTRHSSGGGSRRGHHPSLRIGGFLLWYGAFSSPRRRPSPPPLLDNSPLVRWLYVLTNVKGASRLIGTTRSSSPFSWPFVRSRRYRPRSEAWVRSRCSRYLSFLVTTPGVWARVEGFVVPSEGATF